MTEAVAEVVHVDVDAGIATLTLDSGANRNALSTSLVTQLLDGLRFARDDASVRAVLLTHTGGTFCAGADLGEALRRGASVEEASAAGTKAMVEVIRTMLEIPKPVIARINGHVRAGGFGLLGATDIAFGGPGCSFALTEARLGLAPSIISLTLLPRMTDRAAGRYFLTGETFDAATAVHVGLLTAEAADEAELDTLVDSVIAGIRKSSPQGLAASKKLTTAAILTDFDSRAERLAQDSAALFGSDEAREGMMAFLGKRKPNWDLS